MNNLPIGIQEFKKLREGRFIYVDKTEHIYNLINSASYYFLSRPRRFGKSLLLNTIKEVFYSNKELFEGLWIYDKIEWEKYPVIKISFSNLGYLSIGLEKAIVMEMNLIAQQYDISLESETFDTMFRELIRKLGRVKKVVILIDEYDKPIIDYIDNIPKADENRKILKSFYSVVKDSDNFIKFFFVTGVSKFSHVSIFSDLNNLNDITLDKNYATLTGYTQEELERDFSSHIMRVAEDYSDIYDDIMPVIKRWYNGYSWDGKNFVYNPFSILNFLSKRDFGDYWFSTGTPTFLMKLIKENSYTLFDLKSIVIPKNSLEKYEITSLTLVPLLFQTGYLTIKEVNMREMTLTLDFPNAEVESSFTMYLLASMSDGKLDKSNMLLMDIVEALKQCHIDKFIEIINLLFKGISYILIDNKEKYFHSLFYMIVKLLGFTIESEILTIDGRIDTTVLTDDYIYVIEFKAGQDAKTALNQIRKKKYHLKYANDKRVKVLVGINFSVESKSVDDYMIEKLQYG